MEEDQLDQFREMLDELGFKLPAETVAFIVQMTSNLGTYSHPYAITKGQEQTDYLINFKMDQVLELVGYNAVWQQPPILSHSTYFGVNTRELEEKMKTLSWQIEKQNLQQLPEVYKSILLLKDSGDENAVSIANALQFKYWCNTPVENYINLDKLKEQFLRSHFFPFTGEVGDYHTHHAANLLAGRSLVKMVEVQPYVYEGHWTALKPVAKEEGKIIFEENRYPDFSLKAKILEAGIVEASTDSITIPLIRSLIEGNLTPAEIIHHEKRIPLYLSVDAAQQELVFYNSDQVKCTIDQLLENKNQKEIKGKQQLGSKKGKGNRKGL